MGMKALLLFGLLLTASGVRQLSSLVQDVIALEEEAEENVAEQDAKRQKVESKEAMTPPPMTNSDDAPTRHAGAVFLGRPDPDTSALYYQFLIVSDVYRQDGKEYIYTPFIKELTGGLYFVGCRESRNLPIKTKIGRWANHVELFDHTIKKTQIRNENKVLRKAIHDDFEKETPDHKPEKWLKDIRKAIGNLPKDVEPFIWLGGDANKLLAKWLDA